MNGFKEGFVKNLIVSGKGKTKKTALRRTATEAQLGIGRDGFSDARILDFIDGIKKQKKRGERKNKLS